MNRCEFDPLLADYALDLVEAEEAARLEQHLQAGCPHCVSELEQLRAATHLLADGDLAEAALVTPPSSVWQEIAARIAGQLSEHPASPPPATPPARTRRHWLPTLVSYGVAASLAFALGVAVHRNAINRPAPDNNRQQMGQIERGLNLAPVAVSPLTRVGDDAAQPGIIAWDAEARVLHLFAFDVAPPAGEQLHYAWLVDKQGLYHAAGPLVPGPDNAMAAALDVPLSVGLPMRVEVTLEAAAAPPVAGSTASSIGPAVLAGEIAASSK